MIAKVAGSGSAFRVGEVITRARNLNLAFSGPYAYDVSNDGQHFLINTQRGASAPDITVVVNYDTELSRA